MDLIKLSKQVGFTSRDNLVTVNSDYFYLWGCELQKWLREKHNIDVLVKRTPPYPKLYYTLIYYKTDYSNVIENTGSGNDKTYEEALENGLQEALKLIKNK